MGGQNPERRPPRIADHRKLREWAADYPAWGLLVTCDRCINRSILHPSKLLKLRKPPERFGELKGRLFCGECESRQFSLRPEFLFRRDQ
jgi:hypothetical protein